VPNPAAKHSLYVWGAAIANVSFVHIAVIHPNIANVTRILFVKHCWFD